MHHLYNPRDEGISLNDYIAKGWERFLDKIEHLCVVFEFSMEGYFAALLSVGNVEDFGSFL